MKRLIFAGIFVTLWVHGAGAQADSPVAKPTPSAMATPSPSAGPLAGANSFTEGQARSRLEANGFSNVTELAKDNEGIWRGKAMKNGASVAVAVDYKGGIFSK